MCLLALFFRVVEDAAVVVGANREEYYRRGGEPPRLLDGSIPAVAGVDPIAGGTWLGVNARSVLVAVTNRRKSEVPARPRSRGLLTRELLACPSAEAAVERAIRALEQPDYDGCNYLCADAERAVVIEAGDWLRVRPLPPGLHVLTNRDVNDASDARLNYALAWLGRRHYETADHCVQALRQLCAESGPGHPPMCFREKERGTVSSSIVALRGALSRGAYLHAQGSPDRTPYEDYSALLHELEQKHEQQDGAGFMGKDPFPPGPKGHFLSGHLPEMRRDLLGFYLRSAREHGDCTMLRFGLKRIFFINHPDLIEQVLHSRNFTKHYALRMNRLLLGNGLLTSEGDFWLRQRRLIQPVFQRERIASYAPDMVACAEKQIASWHDGDVRDIHAEMRQLALTIAAKTLFGADGTGQSEAVGLALKEAMGTFSQRFFRVLRIPESIPTPGNLRIRRAVRRLDGILYGLINQRRTETGQNDLLSILLHARHESDGTGMTDKQLRDEAMTLFLAGHETTALALSWGWYLLAQHPEVVERLETELREVLGGRPPTVADLPTLRYTDMIVQEVMRLYPPAYAIGRQAIHPCTIGGYSVPAGATILMSQWVVHRDPRYYDEPERFHPERWADGLAKRLPRYAYFPFGGGQRVCIGNTFALMEVNLILATIAQRFRFTRTPGPAVLPRPQLTLQPDRSIQLRLQALS